VAVDTSEKETDVCIAAVSLTTEGSFSLFGLVIMAFATNVEKLWLMVKSIQKGQVNIGLGAQIGKILWNTTLI
jgi:Ca2+/Na+ antiporter